MLQATEGGSTPAEEDLENQDKAQSFVADSMHRIEGISYLVVQDAGHLADNVTARGSALIESLANRTINQIE